MNTPRFEEADYLLLALRQTTNEYETDITYPPIPLRCAMHSVRTYSEFLAQSQLSANEGGRDYYYQRHW